MIRMIMSIAVIFGVLAAVAGLSQALFSDTASIENSTFATGTVDLAIAAEAPGASPVSYGGSIPGPSVTGLVPGESFPFDFWLRNASAETSVSLDLSALVNDIVGNADVQANLLVGFSCDVGTPGGDPDGTPDGTIAAKSLDAWEADPTPVGDLGTLGPSDSTSDGTGTDEAKCTMTAALGTGATAEGVSATFDTVFTGTQTSAI